MSLKLAFTGDIAFDKYMDKKWEDDNLVSDDILDFLHESDHVIIDVEGPVSAHEDDPNAVGIEQMVHAVSPKACGLLNKLGADVWDICNNHMMDLGQEGLEDTLENAKANGITTIGAGMNINDAASIIYYDEAGGVGVFACGYRAIDHGCKPADSVTGGCLTWNETEIIRDNISKIKEKCRWCIIVCHGGEEFTSLPSPYVRDRLISFLDMGADIIVCHHPHVPMNYELFDGKAIFYSLGNFIFDTDYQRAQYNTDIGVILKIILDEEHFEFQPMGIKIDRELERVTEGELPDIFCNVGQDDYNKLIPLASAQLIEATKQQFTYFFPDKFSNATDEEWEEHFLDPNRMERIAGEILDYIIIYNLALQEKDGAWRESKLDKVKDYILRQM